MKLFIKWLLFCVLTGIMAICLWEWCHGRLDIKDKFIFEVYVWFIIMGLTMLVLAISIAYTFATRKNVVIGQ